MLRPISVIIAGLVLGALIWAFSVRITGTIEPFDGSMLYYAMATFAAGAASAIPSPRHEWLALRLVYLGQQPYAFAAYPDTRAWFLFGLVVNALVPTWLCTAAGAYTTYLIARRPTRR